MNNNIDLILQTIKNLESNSSNYRKPNLQDFTNIKTKNNKYNRETKVKDYRMQEEYGEKKFIKP